METEQSIPIPHGPLLADKKPDSTYGRLSIPHGLSKLVNEISKEVLRYEPSNVYQFLSQYFDERLKLRSYKLRAPNDHPPRSFGSDDIEEFLQKFHISKNLADKYASKIKAAYKGYKVRKEFAAKLHKDHRKSWRWMRWSWEGTSYLSEQQLLDFLQEFNLNREDGDKYATKIQAAYRGYTTRRSLLATSNSNSIELPEAIPLFYDVQIRPDLTLSTFEAQEFIHVVITKNLSSMELVAKGFVVCAAVWRNPDNTHIVSNSITQDEMSGIVRITFDATISNGNGILYLNMRGRVSEPLENLYKSHCESVTYNGKDALAVINELDTKEAQNVFPHFIQQRKISFNTRFKVSFIADAESMSRLRSENFAEIPTQSSEHQERQVQQLADDSPENEDTINFAQATQNGGSETIVEEEASAGFEEGENQGRSSP